MALSLQMIIDDIRSIATSGSNPDEFRISDEQIGYWIAQTRSMLIGQSLSKHDDLNDTWLNVVTCLSLELADASECCLAPSGCYVLKTVKKIPSTIDTWKNNWVVSVTTADGIPISKSNQFSNRYQKYNKYTGNSRYYYLKNDYIYIVNEVLLEMVNVTGLFEDPMQLEEYPSCDGTCFSSESAYPVSANMASQITDIIIKTKIQPLLLQFKQDTVNDGQNKSDEKQ